MRKFFPVILFLIVFGLMSFTAHKFYVSIHQINYADDKKMLQITSRIFIDDLNAALHQKYQQKSMFGEEEESASDVELLKKYFNDHFAIRINGKRETLEYLSREYEANVIICYLRIRNVEKVKKLEITNTMLTHYVTEQQNIIQTTVYGKKQSSVLTSDDQSVLFQY